MNFLRRHFAAVISLALFSLTVWVFLPSLRGDFIYYDDYFYVTSNVHVNTGLTWKNALWALTSLENSNWHPVTWLSHMLDCQFYKLNPWGHHLTGVLLHAANTALVFVVLRGMTGALWRSLAVAVFFGLHPLRVESVAWICERKDVLSTFFALLTLWAYAKYVKSVDEPSTGVTHQSVNRQSLIVNPFYTLALLFFALALMSKTMVVTFPGVLLLLDYWPLDRQGRKSEVQNPTLFRLLVEKVPFLVLAIMASVFEYEAEKEGERMTPLAGLSLGVRMENAVISYIRYLGKMVWPHDLCAFYPHPGHWPMAVVLACTLLLAGISAFAFCLRQRWPWLLAGWLWFLWALGPVIGLVQVGEQSIADRYTYIPSLGVLICMVWGTAELLPRRRFQSVLRLAGATLAAVCIGLTRHQIGYWKDSEVVFQRAIDVTQGNYIAYHDLGEALVAKGKLDDALPQFKEAVKLNPSFALGHHDLGYYLARAGRLDEAVAHYRRALKLQPDDAVGQINLGMILVQQGQLDEAAGLFQKALKIRPASAAAQDGLGMALLQQGHVDDALAHFQKAVELEPKDALNHNNVGTALFQKGQSDAAIREFQEAARLTPDWAPPHQSLGYAFAVQKRFDEAIAEYRRALELQPELVDVRSNLAVVLEMKKRSENRPSDATTRH